MSKRMKYLVRRGAVWRYDPDGVTDKNRVDECIASESRDILLTIAALRLTQAGVRLDDTTPPKPKPKNEEAHTDA